MTVHLGVKSQAIVFVEKEVKMKCLDAREHAFSEREDVFPN